MPSPERRIGVPAELQHDRAAAVDHEVEPAVVPGHGEALAGDVGGDADADQTHPGRSHHLAADHGSATGKYLFFFLIFVG